MLHGTREDGAIDSWDANDIDKMHTYRDALADVQGAFILYPGNKLDLFQAHNVRTQYDGVGAFPLKPAANGLPNKSHVDNLRKAITEFITTGAW